jgi:hypothetical protein
LLVVQIQFKYQKIGKTISLIFPQFYVYKTVSLMTIGKPEAATAVYKLLMMGKRMPETC